MATVKTDNFNAYNNGELVGQGTWGGGANYTVQAATVYEGAKAVSISSDPTGALSANETEVDDGSQVFYVMRHGENGGHYNFGLATTVGAWNIRIYMDGNNFVMAGTNIGTYTNDAWHSMKMEWRSSDRKARYSADEGAFSDWFATLVADGMDQIVVDAWSIDGGDVLYFDTIQEDYYSAATTPSWRDQLQIYMSAKSSKGGLGGSTPSAPCAII